MAARTRTAPVTTPAGTATLMAYGTGVLATAAGLGYALTDQLVLGGLDRHLRAVYEPVGKYGESGPLYAYLSAVGVLGLLCWWGAVRLARRDGSAGRRWGWIIWCAAALPVLAPVVLREYGQPVIPASLAAGYLIAWGCGLVGLLIGRRGRAA